MEEQPFKTAILLVAVIDIQREGIIELKVTGYVDYCLQRLA